MNGAQDMGGVPGFGAVEPEPDEPVFHAEWERRTFALTLAMGVAGGWNIDMSRFAREDRPHQDYLAKSYYQIWLAALQRLMLERNLVSAGEIEAGRRLQAPQRVAKILAVADVAALLHRGGGSARGGGGAAKFTVGNRVRTTCIDPPTHTRLPRYARGHVGVIERIHGVHVFPDRNAHGSGEDPQWLYTVRFDGRELWGDSAEPGTEISIDAFEPYLEPA